MADHSSPCGGCIEAGEMTTYTIKMDNIKRRPVHSIFQFLLLTTVFIGCREPKVLYNDQLAQLHQNVIRDILDETVNPERVSKLLAEIMPDGSWKDIDYTSQERGGWPTQAHISNLLNIAIAYQTKGTKFYHKKEVSEKIHRGLNFWLVNDFICPNWWYPEIGIPKMLNPLMLLMETELTSKEREMGIKILDRSKIGMTGQNRVWQSGNVLLKSLLLKDVETVRKAAETIQEELVVSLKEGVQPDWSYHQHGPQLQIGNYGLAYIDDMSRWISLLRNTPFHFDENKVEILRNYLLEGQQWVIRKDRYDINACGRQVFPNTQKSKAASLARYFIRMEKVDTPFAEAYRQAQQSENLSGNRHFWRSDFQIQRTPNYYFSVKMSSERVIGAETVNSENMRGYYAGDGVTLLYQTTKEYEDIFPYWDWRKLPGITAHQENDTLENLKAGLPRNKSSFTGGVSDGQNGMAVMKYNRRGIIAHKAWFMFDDKVICLGAGIHSAEGMPVTTSVNQSFLNGKVIVKNSEGEKTAGEMEVIKQPVWILHDNTGYFFPVGGALKLETSQVEGSWHWVTSRYPDERKKAAIFKLYIEHGINPEDESYQYILIPGASETMLEQWEKQLPFQITNRKDLQEVTCFDGSVTGIVFYESGKSEVWGGVEADHPCLVMLKKQTGGLQVSVADPTQQLKEIRITVKGEFSGENVTRQNGKTTLKIALPEGGDAGKTVKVYLK
jgi:chondroitin AC lyase